MTLSWSRALYLEFFFDQTMENFLRGHVNAFRSFSGTVRIPVDVGRRFHSMWAPDSV